MLNSNLFPNVSKSYVFFPYKSSSYCQYHHRRCYKLNFLSFSVVVRLILTVILTISQCVPGSPGEIVKIPLPWFTLRSIKSQFLRVNNKQIKLKINFKGSVWRLLLFLSTQIINMLLELRIIDEETLEKLPFQQGVSKNFSNH